jgi:pyridoxal phosphate enzyme (YggS family)
LPVSIAENLGRVQERVAAACRRAGRSPNEITIVGVTKTFPPEAVADGCRAGLTEVGENRVQEAARKIPLVGAMGVRPRWHLIGHLQTNKVKTALELCAMIHSVDSLRLAEAISRRATATVPILLEVNVAGESTKFGFAPQEVPEAVRSIAALPNLEVRGLMTVAPFTADPEEVRPVFRRLRELCDGLGLPELSMGMTDDFEVAIEEGATILRIGRAIFGARPSEG